jgi:hypothetical protein
MLSVLRHERIRHELWIDQDLIVERSLFASELFIAQRIVAVLRRHDGQWGVGGVVVAQERVVGGGKWERSLRGSTALWRGHPRNFIRIPTHQSTA